MYVNVTYLCRIFYMDILRYIVEVEDNTVYKYWSTQYSYNTYNNTWRQHFMWTSHGIQWVYSNNIHSSVSNICNIFKEIFLDTGRYCIDINGERYAGYAAQDAVLDYFGYEATTSCTVDYLIHWLYDEFSKIIHEQPYYNSRFWKGRGNHKKKRIIPRIHGLKREFADYQDQSILPYIRHKRRLYLHDRFEKLYDDWSHSHHHSIRCWKRTKVRKQYLKHLK